MQALGNIPTALKNKNVKKQKRSIISLTTFKYLWWNSKKNCLTWAVQNVANFKFSHFFFINLKIVKQNFDTFCYNIFQYLNIKLCAVHRRLTHTACICITDLWAFCIYFLSLECVCLLLLLLYHNENWILKLHFIMFIYMDLCRCPQRCEQRVGSSRVGVTGGCEL